jgi:hypothetical protein
MKLIMLSVAWYINSNCDVDFLIKCIQLQKTTCHLPPYIILNLNRIRFYSNKLFFMFQVSCIVVINQKFKVRWSYRVLSRVKFFFSLRWY